MTIDHRIANLLRQCVDDHARDVALNAENTYHDLAANCESPIERLFLVPLMFIRPKVLAPRYEGPGDYEREARLYTQYAISGRRLDFAYIVRPLSEQWEIRLGIECDGHEFHASAEQRANDNDRTIELVGEDGFNVIRFTGAQIYSDPMGHAQKVADAVDGIYAANIQSGVNRTQGQAYVGLAGPLFAKIARQAGGEQP